MSMKLKKALNNNVALVLDDKKMEVIIMGKGVAFNVKPGETVKESLIEKRFVLDGDKGRKDFDSLLKRITVDDIELASDIIHKGEKQLGYCCNDSILLTLSDHLGMMLERMKEGLYFGTPLEWDLKIIYPKEYQYAKEVIDYLKEKTGYEIPDQEAAFITLHFINAHFCQNGMDETMLYTKIIQNILNIVRHYYGREFKENDFEVGRFITHVRYFVKRQVNGKDLNVDPAIAEVVAKQYAKDYKCAIKISKFLNQTYHFDVKEGEVLYLSLHLHRINAIK